MLTSTVTVPAGTASASGNGFGTVTWADPAGAWAEGFPVTFIEGTTIMLAPAGALFTAIGSGNLRNYVQGQDDSGHAALSN